MFFIDKILSVNRLTVYVLYLDFLFIYLPSYFDYILKTIYNERIQSSCAG